MLPELSELVSSLPPCPLFFFPFSPSLLAFPGFQWAPAATQADSISLPRNSLKRSTCCCCTDRACPAAPAMLWPNFYLSCTDYKREHLHSGGLGRTELSVLFCCCLFFFPAPLTGRIPFHLRAPRSHACLISAHAFSAAAGLCRVPSFPLAPGRGNSTHRAFL